MLSVSYAFTKLIFRSKTCFCRCSLAAKTNPWFSMQGFGCRLKMIDGCYGNNTKKTTRVVSGHLTSLF